MECSHNYKLEGDHMTCSKCGHERKFSKQSSLPKIVIIGLIISIMVVGAVLIF